jgi:hypothetical protein
VCQAPLALVDPAVKAHDLPIWKDIMRRTSFAVFFIVFFLAYADTCVLAQNTYTAASCNWSDVNALINGPTHTAVDGDVINIPAGSCNWTSGITINVGISIIGAGQGTTTITNNYKGGPLITWNIPSATSSLARLSNLTIAPGSGGGFQLPTIALIQGTCNASTCSHIRWDNLTMTGFVQGTSFLNFMMQASDVFGVMDHMTVSVGAGGGEFIGIGHGAYLHSGAAGLGGDSSWASPDSFGTDNALYLESNTFTGPMAITDTDFRGGARFVVRYNTFTNTAVQTHGTESTGRSRGGRQTEVYDNSYAWVGYGVEEASGRPVTAA